MAEAPSKQDELESPKRQLAQFEVRSAEQARQRLMEQHDAASRWLVASLFAINGGAILAIISSDKADPADLAIAIWGYLIGLILSFIMAVALQISDRKMVAAIHGWGLHWSSYLETLHEDVEGRLKAKKAIKEAESVGRFGGIAGLGSMFLFTISSVYLIGFYTGIGDAREAAIIEAAKID